MPKHFNWPPAYTIRRSKRAKYLKLHLESDGRIILVLPQGVSEKMAVRFLDDKRAWVENHRASIAAHMAATPVSPPKEIYLSLLQRKWRVEYEAICQRNGRHLLRQKGDCLMLSCSHSDLSSIVILLRSWLKKIARYYLSELVQNISVTTKLHYNKLSFRHQRTLWGSCSAQQNISLNVKLLFLPQAQVKYVIIHELCHTQHMDHSKEFWSCVAQHESNYKQLDKEINNVSTTIPLWYDYKRCTEPG